MARSVALLLAAVALAHLPFWLLSQIYAIERAQVSVDVLFALAVLAWRPALGLPMLVLCWLVDGLVSQSMAYHFLSPTAFLDSVRFAGDLRFSSFVSWEAVLGALTFVGAAWGSWQLARLRRPKWVLTSAAILFIAVLDVINGSSRYATADRRAVPMNIAGSPITTLARQISGSLRHDPPVALGAEQSIADVARLADWALAHPDSGIWLVVVESMGWSKDAGLRQQLASALDSVASAGYRVEQRQMPFKGSTTSGELRALCGVIGAYSDLRDVQAARCLPAQVIGMGWTTTALHGFSGRMFDRRSWWPKIGFQQQRFIEELGDLSLCGGAFRGVCDADLLKSSSQLFGMPKQFVYSLTLNTHLPLDPVSVPPNWQAVCDRADVGGNVCELLTAQSLLLARVAMLVRQLPASRRPLVVVIGDHAPPFLNEHARGAFDRTTVPAFILRPK